MFDVEEVRKKLDKLTSDPDFGGDFGGPVRDREILLSEVNGNLKAKFPNDYVIFIQNFGTGQLGYSFFIDPKPMPYNAIFGKAISSFDGVYIFGSDLSECIYAFDSKNNWKIVELDSECDEVKVIAKNFSDFILKKIEDIA